MASTNKNKDVYSNKALATITMSGVDTLTYSQIRFATGLFENKAILLEKALWYPSGATLRQITANTDLLAMAVVNRNDLSDIDPTNLSVYGNRQIIGMGANVEPVYTPIEMDWTGLSGGGLIVSPNPLYLAMTSSGFASAGLAYVVLYYKFMDITDDQSRELLQTLLPGTI